MKPLLEALLHEWSIWKDLLLCSKRDAVTVLPLFLATVVLFVLAHHLPD